MRLRISATEHGGGLIRAVSLCAALSACAVPPALAGDPPASPTEPQSAAAEVVPAAGMRVAVDPATGRPRPLTAEEARVLDAMDAAARKARPAPALQSFRAKGGGVGLKLDESYMVYSVATVGADGHLDMECITGADHARDAVHGHAHAEPAEQGKSNETR